MKLPKDVTLRPHHVARLAHFYNLAAVVRSHISGNPKYSAKTAERISQFYQALFDNPDTVIVVKWEPDDVCKLCDNYKDKRCLISTEYELNRADEEEMLDYRIDRDRYLVREVKNMGSMSFGVLVSFVFAHIFT